MKSRKKRHLREKAYKRKMEKEQQKWLEEFMRPIRRTIKRLIEAQRALL